jgi:hypothetical protein
MKKYISLEFPTNAGWAAYVTPPAEGAAAWALLLPEHDADSSAAVNKPITRNFFICFSSLDL